MFDQAFRCVWYAVIGVGFVLDQFVMPIWFDSWNTVYFAAALFGGWLIYLVVSAFAAGAEWISSRRRR